MGDARRRSAPWGALALVFAVAGCAYTVFAEPEPFDFTPPRIQEWELVYSKPVRNGRIDEYVPPGDDIESWQELMTVFRTVRMLGQSKRDMFEGLQEIREDECPGSTRWNLVEDSDERLIYESWTAPCLGFPDQYELALLVDGTRDRIKLSYAVKAEDIDPPVREAWLVSMRGARLVRD